MELDQAVADAQLPPVGVEPKPENVLVVGVEPDPEDGCVVAIELDLEDVLVLIETGGAGEDPTGQDCDIALVMKSDPASGYWSGCQVV